MKPLLVAMLCPLAACTGTPTTPLSAIDDATLAFASTRSAAHIQQPGSPIPSIELTLSSAAGCPTLDASATATFDGVPMSLLAPGGRDSSGFEAPICLAIEFGLTPAPIEPVGTMSTLVITDGSATWTIEAPDLETHDLLLAAPPIADGSTVIDWTSADVIESAYVELAIGDQDNAWTAERDFADPGITLADRAIRLHVPPSASGTGWLSVEASRTAQATRCDGPVQCSLHVGTGADFAVSIAKLAN